MCPVRVGGVWGVVCWRAGFRGHVRWLCASTLVCVGRGRSGTIAASRSPAHRSIAGMPPVWDEPPVIVLRDSFMPGRFSMKHMLTRNCITFELT